MISRTKFCVHERWLRKLFFAITFFSDINFLLKFNSAKRRTKGLKLCEKKYRSPCSFRRKQSLINLVNLSSKETFLVRTVRALVRALMTQRNYAQYVMRNATLRNHLNTIYGCSYYNSGFEVKILLIWS